MAHVRPAGALVLLLHRAESRVWAGADPYDGLGSTLGTVARAFGGIPRFAISQGILRYQILREVARPAPTVNPKALGLFLGSVTQGRSIIGETKSGLLIEQLLHGLDRGALPVSRGTAWGYPFPWQSRFFWAPVGTPIAVVTAIVGWHLLECADELGDSRATRHGAAAAEFLANGLHRTPFGRGEALSYTPRDSTKIVNISALAARLLARVAQRDDASALLANAPAQRDLAARLTRFVLASQRDNGSWPYAPDPRESWEDSFHTGYILDSLLHVKRYGIEIPERAIARGFEAYRRFFGAEGESRLYPRADSVLDAHSAAQGILTYAALAGSAGADEDTRRAARQAALRIADWALNELWMPGPGCFAYRIARGRRDEREFTRWVSAWMAVAMATAAKLEMEIDREVPTAAGLAQPARPADHPNSPEPAEVP